MTTFMSRSITLEFLLVFETGDTFRNRQIMSNAHSASNCTKMFRPIATFWWNGLARERWDMREQGGSSEYLRRTSHTNGQSRKCGAANLMISTGRQLFER